jgi:hypothetical protein
MRRWVPNFLSFAPNEGQTHTVCAVVMICGKKMFKQRGASVVLEGRVAASRGKAGQAGNAGPPVREWLRRAWGMALARALWGVKRGVAGLQKSIHPSRFVETASL